MPPGVPYIVGNEAAERFSFYGMKAILIMFMVQYLHGPGGTLEPMTDLDAKVYFHDFVSAVYFFPILGALVADVWLGKYRTILSLSIVYCLGHLALALDDTRVGLFWGLALVAIGSGGIKPCVSAHVGDQFGRTNQHLLSKVFGWFYFAINFGSGISTFLIPELLERFGPHVAFAVPGVLMVLATWFFWLGRYKFVHIPPGGRQFLREAFSPEGRKAISGLVGLFAFVTVFWSLYDQSSSSWVLQAKSMDLDWLGVHWLPAQVQVINPVLILAYIPLFSYVIYPAADRVFPLGPLRKITIGFFLAALSFAVSAWIQIDIEAGLKPTIAWQLLAYAILTAAEVMVSITCLEFSYTQAPRRMKSIIMAIYLLSVSLGNLLTARVNSFIRLPNGSSKLAGADYYWFFAGLMTVAAVLFIFVARNFRKQTFVQEEQPATEP
jgi:POT family proton-dependent oligopeptide transporter